MSGNASEEALATYLLKTRMVAAEQIEDARDSQKMAAEHGLKLPLSEALVRLGVITAAQLSNLEKVLNTDQAPQLGNYRIIKKLGAGTMGTVYLAEDIVALRKVALKVLPRQLAESPEFLNRFQSEAQAMGKLNHVNIISAFTVSHDKGKYYYVMEYCDGESLDTILKRETVMSPGQALDIMRQVACGLEHAHSRGLVHRDIKPANIMVMADGTAKILDLGLSKNIAADNNSFSTMSGMAVGTPHYMSPEQARGNGKVDGRADIYSVGATLYHLVCGRPPFEGTDPDEIIKKQVSQKAPNPSDINPDIPDIVAQVIARMLAKSPDDRYQNCAALITDLELVLNGQPPKLIPLEASRSSVEMRGVVVAGAPPAVPQPRREPNTSQRQGRPEKEKHSHSEPKPSLRQKQKSGHALLLASLVCLAGIAVLAAGVMTTMNADADTPLPSDTNGNVPPKQAVPPKTDNAPPGTPAVVSPEPGQAPAVNPAPATAPAAVAKAAPANSADNPGAQVSTEPNTVSPKPGTAVNLIPMIDPAKDTVAGNWQIHNGALACEKKECARIEIPYMPPAEYDFKIEFTRIDGNDSVMMNLSRWGRSFSWKMGDHANTVMGFETIKNADAAANSSTIKMKQCLKTGTRHVAVVKVRSGSLKAYLDGRLVCDVKPNYTEMGTLQSWRLRDNRLLGVGSYIGKVIFHSIEITEFGGKGKRTRT